MAFEGHFLIVSLTLISSLLCGGSGCSDITEIIVLPQNVIINLSFVEIRCVHDGNLIFNSFSTPSGQTLTTSVLDKHLIDSFSSYTSLFILNIEASDIGQYQCNFHYEDTGAECIGQVELSLDVNFCTADSRTYHKYIGEAVTLQCCVENQNSQHWRREDSTEAITAGGNIELDGTNLKILSATLEDEGKYFCVATSADGETEELSASFKVYERLSISLEPQQKVVNVSEMAQLTCTATAYPLPTIVWNREDRTELVIETGVIEKHEVSLNKTTVQSVLTFHNVTNEVTGTYRCIGVGSNGTLSEVSSLQLFGTPSAPEGITLAIIDQININVTWKRPKDYGNLPLLKYLVMWFVMGSQGSIRNVSQQRVNGSKTNYVITNLLPVTNYTVVLYAVNERGKGMGSADSSITTLPYVPGTLSRLESYKLTATSVQLEFTLPSHTGGSPITSLRVSLGNGEVGQTVPLPDARPTETRSHKLDNLKGDTAYTVSVAVGNAIGFGADIVTFFKTLRFGYPATPSSVRVVTVDSLDLTLSWVVEDVGTPSLEYLIRAFKEGEEEEDEEKEEELIIVKKEDVEISGNTQTAKISNLESQSCYTFTVAIRNSEGVGATSQPSNQTCTLSCDQSPCTVLGRGQANSDVPSNAQLIPILVVTVAVAMVVISVVIVVVAVSRHYRRKSSTHGDISFNHNQNSNCSSQFTNTGLDRSLSSASSSLPYHHQNSSNSDDPPHTGSTIVSENPFYFGTSQLQNGSTQYQNKPLHQYENGPDAMSGFQPECHQQIGIMNGTKTKGSYPLFSIPEHCVAMVDHLDNSAPVVPIRAHHHMTTEETIMTENPAFQKPSSSSNLPSHREPQPPPIPPHPRNSDSLSHSPLPPPVAPQTQSQSTIHLHTHHHHTRTSTSAPNLLPVPPRSQSTNSVPFLGESYSQTSPSKFFLGDGGVPDEEEEDEDVDFTENDAYESATPELMRRELPPPVPPHLPAVAAESSATLPPSGPSYTNLSISSHSRGQSASPVFPRRGSTQSGESGVNGEGAQPRFEISRQQEKGRGGRGNVFETVTIKSQV